MQYRFRCWHCEERFLYFDQYFRHCQQAHGITLKRYFIFHYPTKQRGLIHSESPDKACEHLGWAPGECKVTLMEDSYAGNQNVRQGKPSFQPAGLSG